ncbi:CAP domain-containing protein [Sphaerisporangium rhizosphaerae]|uniref:CAP domain-containing protein n=1 Tax=Sphaerisporangium rhizosphaerae TaxID=2269375 RepID=A0ABW2NXM2_9ACTN
MDRHDHPSPGRYNESSSALPPEYLSSEPPSPSGSRKRTLAICAAAAVLAAAVTAGGVITLTGGSEPVSQRSSEQGPGSGDVAAAGDDAADDSADDATSDDASDGDASSGDGGSPGSTGSGGGADGSAGSGQADEGGTQSAPHADQAEPVGKVETKQKMTGQTGTKTDQQAEGQSGGPGPDGPAGYVEPYPQQPGRSAGLGDDPGPGPSASPSAKPSASPSAKPSSKPSTKPSPRPSPRPPAKPSPRPTPKPSKSPTKSTGGSSSVVAAENEVARLTNAARQEQGCGPLRIDEHLRAAARGHSDDMAAKGYFDHTSADGRSPWDRIKAAGYSSNMFAENIARGQATPAAVVQGWLNSPGHRANIMNCKLKAIGVGVHFGSGGPWWTQDFGGT